MKGQTGPGGQNWLLTNLRRSLYRYGWFRSIFGLIIALELLYVFESLFLAMLAFAMLVYIPIPQVTPRLQNPNFYISSVVMLALLFMAFSNSASLGLGLEFTGNWYAPWTWNTIMILFVGFWLISFIACLSGNLESRQGMGAFMIVFASVIFAIGVGGQEMGTAFFGPWWPTVHNFGSQVLTPLGDAISGITSTLGQGWMLLTNPVGYATQLMNGTYAQNPLGSTGAYGVDITELTVTSIFPEQPFVVIAIVENKGAFDAENVRLDISANSGKAESYGTPTKNYVFKEKIIISDLGFKESCFAKKSDEEILAATNCIQYYAGSPENKFEKRMVWQAAFQSSGIDCSVIAKDGYDLRKKYVPIMATLEYDYNSSSRVEVEFISEAEWQRLAQAGQLDSRFKFIDSQYSSAPVIFPIGTAGLKNPILETQDFHISMRLDSAFDRDSQIDIVESVELRYPEDWNIKSCTPAGKIDKNAKTVTLKPNSGGAKTFICYFNKLNTNKNAMGGAPSKTYIVTAHAEYTFSRWKIVDTKIEFGGFCCPNDPDCKENCKSEDCLDYQYCTNNACVGDTTDVENFKGYCGKRLNYQSGNDWDETFGCHLGMGGCEGDQECLEVGKNPLDETRQLWQNPAAEGEGVLGPLTCQEIKEYGIKACCYDGGVEACKAAFNEWRWQATGNDKLLKEYYYPDEKEIHKVYCNALSTETRKDKGYCGSTYP